MRAMEFGLLGPLLVRSGGAVAPVQRGKQRALLATLLLNANRAIRFEAIADTLWGAVPPPSAQATIRNYVKRLRGALGDAGWGRISTQPRGYMISVRDDELDITRFEALLGAARLSARAQAWAKTADQADEALALWRGDALADVECEVLAQRVVPRLAEMRMQAREVSLSARLRLGGYNAVIAELQYLGQVHPFREQLHALLMLALCQAGRSAEALTVYHRVRAQLADELGADPGPELRALYGRILAADLSLNSNALACLPRRAVPASVRPPLRCTRHRLSRPSPAGPRGPW
jgi:DNA-binding SARP family transcriptional activator